MADILTFLMALAATSWRPVATPAAEVWGKARRKGKRLAINLLGVDLAYSLGFRGRLPAIAGGAPTAAEEMTLPDTLEKADAMLRDPVEINRWLQAKRFPDLQARFNKLSEPDLPTQIANILDAREAQNGTIANAAKSAMDEWLKEHGVPALGNRPNLGGAADNKLVVARNQYAKQVEDLGFTNLGDFAREIWHRNPVANRMPDIQKIMNAYSSTEPAAGGFLIPETLDTEIRSLILEESLVRSRATVVPMTSPTQGFPYVDWTTNVGSTYGGWTVVRVPEGGTIPRSQAKFGRARLSVTKQVAGTEIPNEMFVDVPSLDGFIRATLPGSMAYAEDTDYLTGSGANEPLGAINEANSALIVVTKETNQPASTIQVENVLKMYARMLTSSKQRAVWVVNPTTFIQLQTLSIAVGTGGAPVMLVNFANGPVPTMLGRPIIETEKVPALGAQADLSFIDFTYYLIGDRPGSTLESSPHQEFMNDVTVMKMTARNDGRPWIASTFQPANGDTLSPFVALGARA